MLISELIKQLEVYKKKYGDVQVKSEQTDGRSTWYASAEIHIEYVQRWTLQQKEFIISV